MSHTSCRPTHTPWQSEEKSTPGLVMGEPEPLQVVSPSSSRAGAVRAMKSTNHCKWQSQFSSELPARDLDGKGGGEYVCNVRKVYRILY